MVGVRRAFEGVVVTEPVTAKQLFEKTMCVKYVGLLYEGCVYPPLWVVGDP